MAIKRCLDESLNDFDKALELKPDHKIVKLHREFIRLRKTYADAVPNGDKTNNSPRFVKNALRKIEHETKKLEELLAQHEDEPEVFVMYASVLEQQKKYEKAEKYYKIALRNDPSYADVLAKLAHILITLKGDFEGATKM